MHTQLGMAVGAAVLGILARVHAARDAGQTPTEIVTIVRVTLQI